MKTDERNAVVSASKDGAARSVAEGKKEYAAVDLLKFAFALCVVALHVPLFSLDATPLNWTISAVAFRSATPFFFVFSGFFLAKKIFRLGRAEKAAIRSVEFAYCRKLLPPLLFWGIFVAFCRRISFEIKNQTFALDLGCITSLFWRQFATPGLAMWFVATVIVGTLVLVEIYLRFRRWKAITALLATVSFLITLLNFNYSFLFESATFEDSALKKATDFCAVLPILGGWRAYRAFFFMSVGFFLCDWEARKARGRSKRFNAAPFVVAFLGLAALVLEALFIDPFNVDGSEKGYFLSQILWIPGISALAIRCDFAPKLPYRLLRRLSASVYFTHMTVLVLLRVLRNVAPISSGAIVWFLVCAASTGVAPASYRLNNRFINRLIG